MISARNLLNNTLLWTFGNGDRKGTSCQLLYRVVKKQLGELQPCIYSKYANFYSTLKHLLSDITQGIDTEEIKEKCRRHQLMTGTFIDPEDLVQKELTFRFDQALRNVTEQHKHKLKVIQQEHNFLYSQGYDIPVSMTFI